MNVRHGDHSHEVYLYDDGTLDTVLTVDGVEVRFDEADRYPDGSVKTRWLANAAREACDDGTIFGYDGTEGEEV